MSRKIRRALISVYDKTGIVDFARALCDEFGVEIISTGGTAKTLTDAGIPVTLVETITGFAEMLDGRVKTLHPTIHAAILADRDNPEHMRQLTEAGIEPIDMVVVNLYPFEQTIADPDCRVEQAIEMIDIGGPCLLRAAAKNHKHVLVVPGGYLLDWILTVLRDKAGPFTEICRQTAGAALEQTSRYDGSIGAWLHGHPLEATPVSLQLLHLQQLRYGENPHQCAASHAVHGVFTTQGLAVAANHADRECSFNNLVDADAALGLCAELTRARGLWDRLSAGAIERIRARGLWDRLSAGAIERIRARGLWDRLSAGAIEPAPEFPRIRAQTFHRRNLPHIQRPGATYFVTFRVREGRLSDSERDTVVECCLFPHADKCAIHACVVMPDHVHLMLTPLTSDDGRAVQLGEIIKGIKGVSARRINETRKRTGALWQDEYFDRILRHEKEMWETIDYIHENPSRQGLDRDGPYPWCLFEDQPAWDADLHAVQASTGLLRAGQRLPSQKVCARPWFGHRLIAGATSADATSAGATSAGARSAGATSAGAPPAAEKCGTGYQPVRVTGDTAADPTASVACFIKHTNACGVGITPVEEGNSAWNAAGQIEAYRRAYLGDPNAAMGGVLAVNFDVDVEFAAAVMETYQRFGKPLKASGHPGAPGGFFVEVWVAPAFTDAALALIRGALEPTEGMPAPPKKDWGKRVRLLAVADTSAGSLSRPSGGAPHERTASQPHTIALQVKSIAGGLLTQTSDDVGLNEDDWRVVTKRAPTDREMADLRLAWLVGKHTKSNAISICRDGMLIGNGAGQMSRVMSCRVATWLAADNGHQDALRGSAAASDAFFPFRDGPDLLIDAGVTAIIQPGGSKRDAEVIAACDERDVAMVTTGTRHFRH